MEMRNIQYSEFSIQYSKRNGFYPPGNSHRLGWFLFLEWWSCRYFYDYAFEYKNWDSEGCKTAGRLRGRHDDDLFKIPYAISLANGSVCVAGGSTISSILVTAPDGNQTTFGCLVDSRGSRRLASVNCAEYLTGSSYAAKRHIVCRYYPLVVCSTIPGTSTSVKIGFSLSQKGSPQSLYGKQALRLKQPFLYRNSCAIPWWVYILK